MLRKERETAMYGDTETETPPEYIQGSMEKMR